jgi:hypothetical protein
MLVEVCFLVLRDFPLGNIAFLTALEVPFVPQPAGSAASFGMPNHKCLVAVSGDLGKRSFHSKGFNPVQQTAPGGPQFDLFDQYEKIDLFADVFVFDRFSSHFTFVSSISRPLQTQISYWRGARELHPAS